MAPARLHQHHNSGMTEVTHCMPQIEYGRL